MFFSKSQRQRVHHIILLPEKFYSQNYFYAVFCFSVLLKNSNMQTWQTFCFKILHSKNLFHIQKNDLKTFKPVGWMFQVV